MVSVLILANYNNSAYMLAFRPYQSLMVCCKEKNVSVNFLFEFHSNKSLMTFYAWSNFPVMFINLIFSQHLFHMRTSTIIRDQLPLVHFPQLAGEPSLLTGGTFTIQHTSLVYVLLCFISGEQQHLPHQLQKVWKYYMHIAMCLYVLFCMFIQFPFLGASFILRWSFILNRTRTRIQPNTILIRVWLGKNSSRNVTLTYNLQTV